MVDVRKFREVFLELQQVLSSRQNSLTIEEQNLFQACKSKAVRDFTFGAFCGAGVTLAGTWRLNDFIRLNLCAGAALLFGAWRFSSSLDSFIDHILAQDGSGMQKELAKIIVTKYRNDPHTRMMQKISKLFYYEKVFDDSTLDQPRIRLHYRNFFSDDVIHAQRTHNNYPKDNLHGNSHHVSSNRDSSPNQRDSYGESDDKGSAPAFKPVFTKSGTDAATADPLDCLFGTLAREEEIQHSSASSTSPKSHPRSRRYNRRHRRHNQAMPTNFEHV